MVIKTPITIGKKTVHWHTRHMPVVLLSRLRERAYRMGQTQEATVIELLDIGLRVMEQRDEIAAEQAEGDGGSR